jgi:helicase
MSESLHRILDREKQYKLVEHERSLVLSYYRSFLYDKNVPPKRETLIQYAAAARNIASMWADIARSKASRVPADNRSPIARAARIMYFVAELLQDGPLKAHWAREASIAYLQSGNLAAARIALTISRQHFGMAVPGDVFLDAVLAIRRLSQTEKNLLPAALTKPWRCARTATLKDGQERLYDISTNPPGVLSVDKALGYRISQTLPLLGSLSLLKVVRKARCVMPQWYRRSLARAQRLVLLPSQQPAIRKWLSSQSGNGLLCTPTSSGKTFVAEVVSVLSLEAQGSGIAVLVVPYQAIAYGVEKTLKERLEDSDIMVIGAYGEDPVDSRHLKTGKAFLVATPEKLDSLLLAEPKLLQRVRTIVFDELHMLSQPGRGAFYECLIARILLEQTNTGCPPRLFGMSAVISNIKDLAKWLHVPSSNLIVGSWRPNPLFPAYWHPDDKLFVVTDIENVTDDNLAVLENFCPPMPVWPTAQNEHGIAQQLTNPLGRRVAWYAERWHERSNGPVVVFCSSRKQTRELAVLAAKGRSVGTIAEASTKVRQLIRKKYAYLSLLDYCLERGVAYHNAALPAEVRRSLEDAFQAAAIPIVYATTTLAEGSDFPFRSVVIASPSHYDWEEQTQAAMSPLLLRNIAGRGGRTSGHLVGDVVQMYTPFQMTGSGGENIKSHTVFLEHLLDPARSVVHSSLSAGLSKPERSLAGSHLFASFDKVLQRWPANDGILNKYRDCMFDGALKNGLGSGAQDTYEKLMLAGSEFGEPLATINSPLTLTPLGETVLQTCYEVRTAAAIWHKLDDNEWFGTVAISAEDVLESCAQLSGTVPELRELRTSNRRPLKPGNLPKVVQSLLDGGDIIDAYRTAESFASKAMQKKAEELISGDAPTDSSAHERIEVFIDDLKQKIVRELPQLIKAMMLFKRYEQPNADLEVFENLIAELDKARRRIE